MPPDADVVIVGAGVAGLSLAAHLAQRGFPGRVLLVEQDQASHPLRAWATWSATSRLIGATAASFGRVRVHARGYDRVLDLSPYRYRVITQACLRRDAERLMQRHGGFSTVHGTVLDVVDEASRAVVVLDDRAVAGTWVFDSRPALVTAETELAFTGWHVVTDRGGFCPEVPTLMDFRTRQDDGVSFAYVVPTGAHEALIEHTTFRAAGRTVGQPTAAPALDAYLTGVLGIDAYSVTGVEAAILPLAAICRRPRGRHTLAVGLRGGLLKPTTGYAFDRIQRDSVAVVASLARNGHPFELPRSRRRHRWLDDVLLSLIRTAPAQVEAAFDSLFDRPDAAPVLRFLDEDTSLADESRLIAGLSPAPFIRAAAHLVLASRSATPAER